MPHDTIEDVQETLRQITYRPDYWVISWQDDDNRLWFEVVHRRPDALTGALELGRGGKRSINPGWSASDLARNVFGALLSYEEHEVREFFRFCGQQVFSPHMDLVALAEQVDAGTISTVERKEHI